MSTEPLQPPEAPNVLDELLDERRRVAETIEATLDLPIGIWNGRLVPRYHPLPWEEANEYISRVQKSGNNAQTQIRTAKDVLIHACDEILIRRGDEVLPIRDVVEGIDDPVRYDSNLANLIGAECATAREVVEAVFSQPNKVTGAVEFNKFALIAHQNRLIEWLGERGREDGEDF